MKRNSQLIVWFSIPFVIGCCISVLIAWQINRINNQHINDALHRTALNLTDQIMKRINLFQYGLRGVRGAVVTAGENTINRELFKRYSLTRSLNFEFPGAHGFGFIRRVAQEQEEVFLEKARRDGHPNFTIRQLSPHEGDRYVIQYIEPMEQNSAAIGLDTASESSRRDAAIAAMQSGNPTITRPITLVQAPGHIAQSFLIFLPIYRTVVTPETRAEREAQLYGWSYTPLLMKDVLANLLMDKNTIRLRLKDITQNYKGEIFFTSPEQPDAIIASQTINRTILGRRWQIEFSAYPLFEKNLNLLSPKTALLIGCSFSFLLASVISLLGINQQRKRAIAIHQGQIAAIVENSLDGIIGQDLQGKVTSWNHGAENIFGYSTKEAIGKTLTDLIVPSGLEHEEIDILSSIREGLNVANFTTTRERKNKSTLNVSVSIAPIRNADGEIIGASKSVRDITEQKMVEDRILELNSSLEAQVIQRTAQLELAHRSLQTVLDAVPSMIGYWDKHLINKVANKAYSDWFGLEHKKIPGMHASELLGDKLFQANKELMEAALRGEAQTFHRTIPTPTGERHSLAHYLPDIKDGEVQGFYVIVHDITAVTEANKNLQKALRENEVLLSTINQQLLYSVTDIQGNIIDINDNLLATCGYTREQLIGKNHRLLSSGLHNKEFWKMMWADITNGKSWYGEICNRTPSGNLYWLDSVIAPFKGADGKIERYVVLSTNITERKQAEKERNQLSLLISNVLSAASEVSIIATDIEGTIVIFNRGAELMLGYEADELVGKSTPAVFHLAEEVEARAQELSQEYKTPIEGFRAFVHKSETEGSETRDWTYVRKDGSHLQVSLAVTTMRDASGSITGYLGVAADVTEELQNKLALKSTINQLDIAANVAELGIWTWDISDNSLSWSDRMFEMYDQPLSLRNNGLNYQHWYERVHPDDAIATVAALTTAVEGHGEYNLTFRILTPRGVIRYIQAAAQIQLDATGKAVKVIGINKDITSQRQLEVSLRQAKEIADSASASKSAFLANMSHEIRTPMNAVLGMLQLLKQTELTQRQQDYISKSQTAAKSLLGLLNDILDFSKIDSGKLQLDNHPFEVESLMRDLAVILSDNQGNKDVEIMFDIDPQLPNNLIGDQLRLHQILINLAGNALKFTNHGQVLITLKLLEKKEKTIRLHIAVSDTGIGISGEQIDRIFEAFEQAEASTSRRFGGTGLGLVISRRLVSLMGSNLYAESEIGIGSRFWFDLELQENDIEKSLLQSTMQNISGLQVLVVDDNSINREILVRTITSLGAQAGEADDGLTAIQKLHNANLSQQTYDVVLMDSNMPSLDGLSTAELIRDLPTYSLLPIVIMASPPDFEKLMDQQKLVKAPYSELLMKPITPQQLSDSILRAIAGSTPVAHTIVPPVIRQQSLAGIHLLVVEDNALNRQVASELLMAEGAIVDLAEGGLEGIDKVLNGQQSFDVIIMDMQMPDIDGLEATRRIRAHPNYKDLPILAMTANASAADREACLAAGMNDHLGKPIDIEKVVPIILALINKQATEKPTQQDTDTDNATDALIENMDIVLKRFGGDIAMYREMLTKFYPHLTMLLNNLALNNQQMKITAVTAILHSIKGVAMTVGAQALAIKSANLEKQLKSTNNFSENNLLVLTQETLHELNDLLHQSAAQLQISFEEYKARKIGK